MIFRDPAWLALLPVVGLAGWVWRGLQLQRPLRAGFVLLIILLLMRPQWQRLAGGMDLWVLLDRSALVVHSCEEDLHHVEPRLLFVVVLDAVCCVAIHRHCSL